MDRILPSVVSDLAFKSIEHVYSYAPLAEKTVVLGKLFKRAFYALTGVMNQADCGCPP